VATLSDTYALPAEVVEFRDAIRQIVVERVAPRAAEIDEQAAYPWDLRQLFAEHGPPRAAVRRRICAAPEPGR